MQNGEGFWHNKNIRKFKIDDLQKENAYLISMQLRLCLEDEHCYFETKLFDNMLAPKMFCNYSISDTFPIEDFSLINWMSEQGINSPLPLSQVFSAILLDKLGVSAYLDNSCYDSGDRLNSSCRSLSGVHKLPPSVDCSFSDSCLEMKCCYYDSSLLQTFKFSLVVDPCTFFITASVEKYTMTRSFFDFNMGIPFQINFGGILRFEGTYKSLPEKKTLKARANLYVFDILLPACEYPVDVHQLPENINCQFDKSCSNFTCCVNVLPLQRSFVVAFVIDSCENKLERTLEKYKSSKYLFNHNWGEIETMSLFGVIKQRFSIENLEAEKKYIVNFGISVCLESNSKCLTDIDILSNAFIPKTSCDWNYEFINKEFDYLQWRHTNNIPDGVVLSQNEIMVLAEELECTLDVALPKLPDGMWCSLGSDCYSVDCCNYLDFIRHDIMSSFHLEPCSFLLHIKLEKLAFTINLFEFKWNDDYVLRLFGIFALRFRIQDLQNSGIFIIDISVEICQSAIKECNIINIFENVQIPKPACEYDTGFKIPEFSLATWLIDNNLDVDDMNPVSRSQLYEDIGISPYLNLVSCEVDSSNSWLNGCTQKIRTRNITEHVSCSVGKSCTDFQCCVNSELLQRTFTIEMNVNACSKKLNLAIEQLYMNISLLDFTWGTANTISMFGVVRLSYVIDYLELSNVFLASLNVSICLEADRDCDVNSAILTDAILPIQPCHLDTPFKLPDFSLTNWLKENGHEATYVVPDDVVSYLFEILGITSYLQPSQCSARSNLYTPAIQGWKKDCTHSVYTSRLPNYVTCLLTDTCSGISCCVMSHLVGRAFETVVDIDRCGQILHLQIETLQFDIAFQDFEWGTSTRFCLFGVVCLEISIKDLASLDTYIVSLDISVCFETNSSCNIQATILESTLIPKQPCYTVATNPIPDFDLTTWLHTRAIPEVR
ncbi:hypothetical protein MAR_020493 [Mya arenaria]|uniref:Uncharacterized protein n=1 Tax=Mya arenaria TaxID=6604 RepID=A0ABY7E7I9_MYAAR|nr:hypothetical protein MAR_020493 [Mya arenaria]